MVKWIVTQYWKTTGYWDWSKFCEFGWKFAQEKTFWDLGLQAFFEFPIWNSSQRTGWREESKKCGFKNWKIHWKNDLSYFRKLSRIFRESTRIPFFWLDRASCCARGFHSKLGGYFCLSHIQWFTLHHCKLDPLGPLGYPDQDPGHTKSVWLLFHFFLLWFCPAFGPCRSVAVVIVVYMNHHHQAWWWCGKGDPFGGGWGCAGLTRTASGGATLERLTRKHRARGPLRQAVPSVDSVAMVKPLRARVCPCSRGKVSKRKLFFRIL